MGDPDIFEHINALSNEEERLYQQAGEGDALSSAEIERLRVIKVELDRCYDLLHQRQGRRDAGQDPAGASLRPARTVEGYEQ
ncbi:MAG TPA: DUF2630 family protein [Candidatus Limnocylindrales bacterium]|jgi:hypothetical protein